MQSRTEHRQKWKIIKSVKQEEVSDSKEETWFERQWSRWWDQIKHQKPIRRKRCLKCKNKSVIRSSEY